MRYLNKVIFLNSAHVPYAEVKLDGDLVDCITISEEMNDEISQ